MAIGNNLYPPIISTYMPAFVRTSPCKVYFSLSPFNTQEDIMNVQVSITNIKTNKSALNKTLYPSEIKLTNLLIDTEVESDEKYYVIINPGDVQQDAADEVAFALNQYYKVQLRFTAVGAQTPPAAKISSWLLNNTNYFSEWSTACLIKGIEQPLINLNGLSDNNVLNTHLDQISGRLYFNNSSESETLKWYRIQIAETANLDEIKEDSGIIYTDSFNPNEINYKLKYDLEESLSYSLLLSYGTRNDFESVVKYKFIISSYTLEKLDAKLTATLDEENGFISVNIKNLNTQKFYGILVIKRSNNKTNFTQWEEIKNFTAIATNGLDLSWKDFTIESGVWYKYAIQRVTLDGGHSPLLKMEEPILATFENCFLSYGDRQLKLKYDNSLSSLKWQVLESKTETLGSKYPFIRKNANTKYRTFPLGGLITSFQDEENYFTTKEELYGDLLDNYVTYNKEAAIDQYYDYIYEGFFREKVMEFLTDNTVKLFRSPTEGNILVKLMDISFTPNQSLSRMLYSFSSTAYEIDDKSLENIQTYKIQNKGVKDYTALSTTSFKLGQVFGDYSAGTDLIQQVQNNVNISSLEGFTQTVNYLSSIKINFTSAPYLIEDSINGPQVATDGSKDNLLIGYLLIVNGNTICVSAERAYYELSGDSTKITSLAVPASESLTLDYVAHITETAAENSDPAVSVQYTNKVGQLWGTFDSNVDIVEKISERYYIKNDSFYQKVIAINYLSIEADPHTIIQIEDSYDNQEYRYEIGETGTLTIQDDDVAVSSLKILGVHLRKYEGELPQNMEIDEYYDTGIVVADTSDISLPRERYVYTVGTTRMVVWQGQWYEFSDTNDIMCAVDAIINYHFELVRGDYL